MREILLASLVGRVIPKADVAGAYLFVAFFGWRMNGIREACSRLGFNVASLTPLQAAAVVARLRYPEQPTMSDDRAHQIAMRARRILRLVEGEGVPAGGTNVSAGTAPRDDAPALRRTSTKC